MAILDMLQQQLSGNTLSQISQQLGTDENTTGKAVALALPMLLGGLAKNAATDTGAAAIDQALTRDHDGSLLDNPDQAVANPMAFGGGGILGHIFGQRQAPVEQITTPCSCCSGEGSCSLPRAARHGYPLRWVPSLA
jgi:hypothetical protein